MKCPQNEFVPFCRVLNVVPGCSKCCTCEVELPGLKGEEHRAPHRELFAPLRAGIAGQDKWVLDLLHDLVGELLAVELLVRDIQLATLTTP